EVLYQLQPAFAAHVQPLEDRRELLWNRAALVGAQLPPRPVEQIEESGDAFAPRQGCQRLAGGLSAAIPPVPESRMELHPGGVPASVAVEISADSRGRIGDLYDGCRPCGC